MSVSKVVSDPRAFFAVIDRSPSEVTTTKDVFEFIAGQRRGLGDGRVVRLSDGQAGLAARTIRRRLAVMSSLFNYLVMCGEMFVNPVPRGMASRRTGGGGQPIGSPLIRTLRTLPRVLDPGDVVFCWARFAGGGTGRWSKRWCSAGCVVTK
jgi:integrase/recombinase XerD